MEIPVCPVSEHAGSRVVRGGWYGKPSHRRQRWLCRPTNGDPKHRFTPVLTRQGQPHPFCVECSTGLELWEGQAGAREYRFSAREVGEALVLVAKGSSYRAAAELARQKAGLVLAERGHGRRSAANEGQLVANWVDVCSGFICAGELPERWPHAIAVDSQNFRVKSGAHRGRGFHVLAAVGREQRDPDRWAPIPILWRLEPFARKDLAAWEAFLGSLEAAPRVIVSDADNALTLAVNNVFGDRVEHRLCEWHLGRKLREHLPAELLADGRHPIVCTLPEAFRGPENWRRLQRAIETEHAEGKHGRSRSRSSDADLRPARGGPDRHPRPQRDQLHRPCRASPARGRAPNRQPRRLVHQPRPPGQAADLITLDMTGKADGRAWADQLRERLYLADGRPANQRPHDDPKGVHSLFL